MAIPEPAAGGLAEPPARIEDAGSGEISDVSPLDAAAAEFCSTD